MYEQGLVSILIPCYNASRYLTECLDAILNQTYKKIELVIVNDGSIDDSERIIDEYSKKFKNNKMRLIKINQKNGGQESACNNGLKHVNGEYLYWQDADDVLELDAIENMVNFLKNNLDMNIVRGKVSFRNEDTFNVIESVGEPLNPRKTDVFNEYLFEKGSYCFVGVFMVRMHYFDAKNPKRELYISSGGQNYQLLLPIMYHGQCGYLDAFVYKYRIVENSHSHSAKRIKDKLVRCKVHEDIIYNVLNSICEMSEKERKIYKIKVKFKYFKRRIIILTPKFIKNIIKGIRYYGKIDRKK